MKKLFIIAVFCLMSGLGVSQVPSTPDMDGFVIYQPLLIPLYTSLQSANATIVTNTAGIASNTTAVNTATSNITTIQGQITALSGISQNFPINFYCTGCVGSVSTVTARLKKDALGVVTLTVPSFSALTLPLGGALITTASAGVPTPLPVAYRPTAATQVQSVSVNSLGINQVTAGSIQILTTGNLVLSLDGALGVFPIGNAGLGLAGGSEVTVTYAAI